MDFAELNRKVIAEFRENGGKVGGMFEGVPLVLLHTTGRRSGKEYVSPLAGWREGERLFVMASKAGAPDNPDWYHNVRDNPDITVEDGTKTWSGRAVEVTGGERDRIFDDVKTAWPNFAEYEQSTPRKIPVVELQRA